MFGCCTDTYLQTPFAAQVCVILSHLSTFFYRIKMMGLSEKDWTITHITRAEKLFISEQSWQIIFKIEIPWWETWVLGLGSQTPLPNADKWWDRAVGRRRQDEPGSLACLHKHHHRPHKSSLSILKRNILTHACANTMEHWETVCSMGIAILFIYACMGKANEMQRELGLLYDQ